MRVTKVKGTNVSVSMKSGSSNSITRSTGGNSIQSKRKKPQPSSRTTSGTKRRAISKT